MVFEAGFDSGSGLCMSLHQESLLGDFLLGTDFRGLGVGFLFGLY